MKMPVLLQQLVNGRFRLTWVVHYALWGVVPYVWFEKFELKFYQANEEAKWSEFFWQVAIGSLMGIAFGIVVTWGR